MAKDILNMKSACAYIRVSTDKQEELSPDAQKRLLIDFAKKNNMSLLAENIYIDNGISGKKADKRPEFMKMIGMAKAKNTHSMLFLYGNSADLRVIRKNRLSTNLYLKRTVLML